MTLIKKLGKVQSGGIVFSKPLALPEGTEVVVNIEPLVTSRNTSVPTDSEDFSALPFFGMWSDREDMNDSIAWTRRERERWQQRAKRKD